MYLLLIGIGFLASLAFSIILQRLSSPTHLLSRLKKTIHLHEHSLIETAREQSQKIKDAFLDYEMLFQQSQQNQGTLQQELEEYTKRVEDLRSNENLVRELSLHLNEMAASANTVSQRVESLDIGMQKLKGAEKEIQRLHEKLDTLSLELEKKGDQTSEKLRLTLEERLGESIEDIIQQTQAHAQEIIQRTHSSYQVLEEKQQEFHSSLEKYQEEFAGFKRSVEGLPQEIEKKWEHEMEELNSKSEGNKAFLNESFAQLEKKLGSIRNQAIEALQEDLKLMQKEMEDLNLQTMSRRDEILNETKRMALKVQEQSQSFQEHYLSSENHLLQEAEVYQKKTDEHVRNLLEEWKKEQEIYQEEMLEKWHSLKENISQVEGKKLLSMEAEGKELEENIKNLSHDLQMRLSAQAKDGLASIEEQTQQSYSAMEEKIKVLESELIASMEGKSAEMEEQGEAFLNEQKGLYSELKTAAEHVEEDLKERINIESLLANFEKEAQERLFTIQKDISSFSEELEKNSGKAQEGLELSKQECLEDIREELNSLEKQRADMEGFSKNLKDRQTEAQAKARGAFLSFFLMSIIAARKPYRSKS